MLCCAPCLQGDDRSYCSLSWAKVHFRWGFRFGVTKSPEARQSRGELTTTAYGGGSVARKPKKRNWSNPKSCWLGVPHIKIWRVWELVLQVSFWCCCEDISMRKRASLDNWPCLGRWRILEADTSFQKEDRLCEEIRRNTLHEKQSQCYTFSWWKILDLARKFWDLFQTRLPGSSLNTMSGEVPGRVNSGEETASKSIWLQAELTKMSLFLKQLMAYRVREHVHLWCTCRIFAKHAWLSPSACSLCRKRTWTRPYKYWRNSGMMLPLLSRFVPRSACTRKTSGFFFALVTLPVCTSQGSIGEAIKSLCKHPEPRISIYAKDLAAEWRYDH